MRKINWYLSGVKSGRIRFKYIPEYFKNYKDCKKFRQIHNPSVTTLYGTRMFLNNHDMMISKSLYFDKFWELNETNFFKKIINKGMNVVDIGANIGYFSILFSRWIGETGKVFCFEPEPDNFHLLQKNIQANNCENIIPIQKAVSNSNGTTSLFLSEENKGDHRIIDFDAYYKDELRKEIEVESIKLDSAIPPNFNIDIIKMDIQGAEMLAMEGMLEILNRNYKMYLVTEFWPYAIEKSGHIPRKLLEQIIQTGFKISILKNGQQIPIENPLEIIHDYSKTEHFNLICEKTLN